MKFVRLLGFTILLLQNTIAHAEQRIIALAPHIVEMLFTIGAGDRIVGTVSFADYPQAALDIPRIGGYNGIQIEKILQLQPDLIIAWQSGNSDVALTKLKKMGIKVVYSHPEKLAHVARQLRYLGKLTNLEAQANIAATAYETRLAAIRQANMNKTPIKVFYQLWSAPMMTINKDTPINQLIEVCQGKNVFADNSTLYPKVGIENVIVAQPDLIILVDEHSDTKQPIIEWHKWPEIPAVKNNQFITVNADLIHRFSSRMLDGIEDMCGKLDEFR
jgi:vitamin B12 transport system substrate-binding protein